MILRIVECHQCVVLLLDVGLVVTPVTTIKSALENKAIMDHFAKNVNDTFTIMRFQMTWTKN